MSKGGYVRFRRVSEGLTFTRVNEEGAQVGTVYSYACEGSGCPKHTTCARHVLYLMRIVAGDSLRRLINEVHDDMRCTEQSEYIEFVPAPE